MLFFYLAGPIKLSLHRKERSIQPIEIASSLSKMNWSAITSPNGQPPSALTTGLAAFLTLLFLLNKIIPIFDAMTLSPQSMFNIGRLSNYPLAHLSFFHLFFNVISLMGPLNLFESQHGTVHTGVVLNLAAVITGLLYCLFGRLAYPDASVAGASGWCFTMFGYFGLKESALHPRYHIPGSNFAFPTVLSPLVLLILISIFVPGVSFWGHFFALMVGYFIGSKEKVFRKIMPPSWIIQKIEEKAEPLIALIPSWVKFYREKDMTERDTQKYSSVFVAEDSLPLHNAPEPTRTGGRVLGTA